MTVAWFLGSLLEPLRVPWALCWVGAGVALVGLRYLGELLEARG